MDPSSPHWVSAFLDLPPRLHAAGAAYWSAITGYAGSAPRGLDGGFATLLPPATHDQPPADAFLRVQRLGATHPGGPRVHLDLHVADPVAASRHAERLGATRLPGPDADCRVLRSPGGLTLCFVTETLARRPAPRRWPTGQSSLVDQVCLDVPAAGWAAESAFWSALTGWRLHQGSAPEFGYLQRPPDQPLRILLQRVGSAGDVGAHLDLATDDRVMEVASHVALGGTVVATHPHWTVLRDPAGSAYCVTDRDPHTGSLPRA